MPSAIGQVEVEDPLAQRPPGRRGRRPSRRRDDGDAPARSCRPTKSAIDRPVGQPGVDARWRRSSSSSRWRCRCRGAREPVGRARRPACAAGRAGSRSARPGRRSRRARKPAGPRARSRPSAGLTRMRVAAGAAEELLDEPDARGAVDPLHVERGRGGPPAGDARRRGARATSGRPARRAPPRPACRSARADRSSARGPRGAGGRTPADSPRSRSLRRHRWEIRSAGRRGLRRPSSLGGDVASRVPALARAFASVRARVARWPSAGRNLCRARRAPAPAPA